MTSPVTLSYEERVLLQPLSNARQPQHPLLKKERIIGEVSLKLRYYPMQRPVASQCCLTIRGLRI